MNKYIILLLILFTGFTPTDIRREIITLEWEISDAVENKLGQTFPDAGYAFPGSQVPIFFKSFPVENHEQNFQFVLENPQYEEIESHQLNSHFHEIPEEFQIKQNRLKSGENKKIEIQIPAIIRKGEKILKLNQFALKQIPQQLKSAQINSHEWKNESVLKEGKWVKIRISEKGIYKIPYSKLTEYGFTNPSQVKVFGAGGIILSEDPGKIDYDDLPQVAVWHGKNNGADCLFFYAPGTVEWNPSSTGDFFDHRLNSYTQKGHFFLSENGGSQKNIQVLPVIEDSPTHSISSFNAFQIYKTEKINLIHSGKQWFSDKFINGTNKDYSFELQDIENASDIYIRVNAAARSSSSSEMPVSANQTNLGKINFSQVNTADNASLFADGRSERFTFPAQAENLDLKVQFFGSGSSPEAWLDFIEINYIRKLKTNNELLFFRDKKSVGQNNILEFAIETGTSDLKVWDVTDAFNVQEIPTQINNNKATGKRPADSLKEYVAFSPNGNFPEPELVGGVENQNLHGISTPEFLIISHPIFLTQANQLADFHRTQDNMKVEVVASDKIYNEFSSGNKDATGIRNFIKMFYDRNDGLKYVLLFGDGSYDNKGILEGSTAFIPTFQSENSLNPVYSFVTDDYFVMLDAGESVYSGAIDLGIGRIPASTTFEAEIAIKKVNDYHNQQALGNWRNMVSFIADDEDGNLHMSDSEKLANYLNENHGEFITDKIYFDAYQQITGPGGESYPEVTGAINQRVKDGVLVLNYVGHANERFLADEKVLDISHINSWSNSKRLFIFVTATCEFSRFDADDTSAGEYVLFNSNGGGIGLFSTTRLVFAYSNYLLSRSFYNFVFEKNESGEHYRMGDIMRLAKINTINTTNKRNFSLLADPALKLSYPRHRVFTTTINGHDATQSADTVGAMQAVTVTGYVGDESGNKLNNFSGDIIPTVYDKAVMMSTMGNAGERPMNFKVQENIIYKGLAEVTNGDFSFSFVIPKDISYSLGKGKIIYYAQNEEVDAHGVFDNLMIGGPGSEITDNEGPEIELFLDSPDFIPGDKVSKNPTLLAYLSDENGINTAGSGIGHDITAVLNNDYSKVMVLNNYYQANAGDFTSGTLSFPMKDIPVGKNSLKLKAWDVANNSTEVEIEFEVTGEFEISNVANYPNPVSDYTFFTFDHNQADATFEVIFEIFDQNGSRIDYFTTQVGSNGTVSNPVRWDLNETKIQMRSGIYIFRVTAQNSDGIITSNAGKLLVAR
ncbi:type IX secretion system sortase PorU [Mariniphaga sp.]|uniref:type IX secretion system sortase PorU n=1 Tax=Mariniphaga sp. TaxID=1954475 RepID=UPI0035631EFB